MSGPARDKTYEDLANLHYSQRNFAALASVLREMLSVRPDDPDTHNNLGVALRELGEIEEAADLFRRAVTLSPGHIEARVNLGGALADLGDPVGAERESREALAADPGNTAALHNLGNALRDQGALDAAVGCFDRALAIAPNDAEAGWNRALSLLSAGRYDVGWAETDAWGWASGHRPKRDFPFPRWAGSPLRGKTILVTAEQGVGDEIMYASIVPDLLRSGARVILECDRRLAPLFARSFPGITTWASTRDDGETREWLKGAPTIDFEVPAASLPRWLRRSLEDFPRRPYLRADPERVSAWRRTLADLGPGPKIGISWRGGGTAVTRRKRSIPLEQWGDVFGCSKSHFVSLQYGDHESEIEAAQARLGLAIHRWAAADPLRDLDEAAAQISALDLILSVDNTTVHLAGALGMPVWTLLRGIPNWRWGFSGEVTPWYPTMRLLRAQEGSIDPLMNQVARSLESVDWSGDAPRSNAGKHARPPERAVTLLNDTSDWYHWGCHLTSSAIKDEIAALGFKVLPVPITAVYQCSPTPESVHDFDDATFLDTFIGKNRFVVDRIRETPVTVVNGEGTLHGTSVASVNLLYLAYLAKRHFSREVHIINHSAYPDDQAASSDSVASILYKKVYQAVDFVAVREETSGALLDRLGVANERSFDCLPLAVRRRGYDPPPRCEDLVVLAGSVAWDARALGGLGAYVRRLRQLGLRLRVLVGAHGHPAADDAAFVRTLDRELGGGLDVVDASSAEAWLDALAQASLLVSGRFHHSIAAAFLGTPFVALDSNTPKMQALCSLLNAPPPLSYSDPSLFTALWERTEGILCRRERPPTLGEHARNKLLHRALVNFDGLRRYAMTGDVLGTEDVEGALGDHAEALGDAERGPRLYLATAEGLEQAGAADKALVLLRGGSKRHDSDVGLLEAAGRLALRLDRDEEAFDALQRAAELAPSRGDLVALLAALLLKHGRPEDAVELAESALLRATDAGEAALLVLGDAYRAMGSSKAALAAYGEALRVRPGDLEVLGRIRSLEKYDAGT